MSKIQPKTFIKVEAALAKDLKAKVVSPVKKWAKEVAAAYDSEDSKEREELIDELTLEKVFPKVRTKFEVLGMAAILFGVSRVVRPDRSLAFKDKKAKPDALKKAVAQAEFSVQNSVEYIKEVARQTISNQKDKEVEVTKAEKIKDFVPFFQKKAVNTAQGQMQLIASLHNSRLSVYGFTVEATYRNLTQYKVNAVLDSRTSDVCTHMNGKVFELERVRTFIQSVLDVEDPKDLKNLAPWPRQDKASLEWFKSLSNDQLAENGWMAPPYHPNCRTYLDVVSQTDLVSSVLAPQTVSTLANLGVTVTDKVPSVDEVLSSIATKVTATTAAALLASVKSRLDSGVDDVTIMTDLSLSYKELESIKREIAKGVLS